MSGTWQHHARAGNVWTNGSGELQQIGITNGSTLVFSGPNSGYVTNGGSGSGVTNLVGITFSNALSGSYVLKGNAVSLGSGGIANNSTNAQTVSLNITLRAGQYFNPYSGDLLITGAVSNSTTNTLIFSGRKYMEISGSISGLGGVSMWGAGTVTLSGSNNYTGTTTITNGTLQIGPEGWGDLVIGNGPGQSTNLVVRGGVLLDAAATIGKESGTIGRATVTGGTWINGGSLVLGDLGSGTLTLGSGTVSSVGGILGNVSGSSGTMMITNRGVWRNEDTISVGYSGAGNLTISNGSVSNLDASVASQSNSRGSVTVNGGGFWSNSGVLCIGDQGSGTLTLGSGTVSSMGGVLGNLSGSTGTVIVSSGGVWTNNDFLTVGESGAASLTINGGVTFNDAGIIADAAGSSAGVTVTGNGAWMNGSFLVVGDSGNGTLTVGSGVVSNTYAVIASDSGSAGKVTVSNGGIWRNSSEMTIGNLGSASLEIIGGTVSNTAGIVGNGIGSIGVITVTDGGNWSNGEALTVGMSGQGTLTIGSGTVTSAAGIIGSESDSSGSVDVRSGGVWNNGSDLIVGNSGNGSLVISGGKMSAFASTLGFYDDAAGVVGVNGGGVFTNASKLVVGQYGSGTLTVSDGQVFSGGGILGDGLGSSGSALVGSGGLWNSVSSLTIGNYGSGALTISGSGTLTVAEGSGTVVIAANELSVGVLNIGSQESPEKGGRINAAAIIFGDGDGTINFNQTNTITIDAMLLGSQGRINQLGSGTTILNAHNSFSSDTVISAGTLVIGANGSLSSTNISLGTMNSRGTLDLAAKVSGYSIGSDQILSGSGSVTMAAGQTLAVYGGLAPGNSTGVLTVAGNLELKNSAMTIMEVAGPGGPGELSGYDQVNVLGNFTPGGVLVLRITGGIFFSETHPGIYTIFNAGSISAANFSSIRLDGDYTGNLTYYSGINLWQTWDAKLASGSDSVSDNYIGYNMATGVLTIVPEPSTGYLLCVGVLPFVLFFRRGKLSRRRRRS